MIIGSTAIKHWFPDFNREPKDLDYVCIPNETINEHGNKGRIEKLKNPILLNWLYDKYGIPIYCPPNELYTLKISHVFWDLENGSWSKHMWDIQFLKEKGCELIPELFHKLYDYWQTIHGKNKRSDLNMSAEDFFDNAVKYPIAHDDLHELLIKHPYFEGQQKPTYSLILKDGAEVDVDEQKYNQLTEKQKFNLVFEEVAVMAIERYNKMYYKAAYEKMLKKFIIGHAPIWEALWIIQNHKLLLTNIPFNFLDENNF